MTDNDLMDIQTLSSFVHGTQISQESYRKRSTFSKLLSQQVHGCNMFARPRTIFARRWKGPKNVAAVKCCSSLSRKGTRILPAESIMYPVYVAFCGCGRIKAFTRVGSTPNCNSLHNLTLILTHHHFLERKCR